MELGGFTGVILTGSDMRNFSCNPLISRDKYDDIERYLELKNAPDEGLEFGKRSHRKRGAIRGDFGVDLAPPKPLEAALRGIRRRP